MCRMWLSGSLAESNRRQSSVRRSRTCLIRFYSGVPLLLFACVHDKIAKTPIPPASIL